MIMEEKMAYYSLRIRNYSVYTDKSTAADCLLFCASDLESGLQKTGNEQAHTKHRPMKAPCH